MQSMHSTQSSRDREHVLIVSPSPQLFDELRLPDAKMQNGKDLPLLFDFTREGKCALAVRTVSCAQSIVC